MAIAKKYTELLSDIPQIILPRTRTGATHVNHLFVIEAEKRDELQDFLRKKGISTLIHYPIPIHKQKCFSQFNSVSLPITEKKVKSILSLPIHPYLNNDEIVYICKNIRKFYE